MNSEIALTIDMELLETSKFKYKTQNTARKEKRGVRNLLDIFNDYDVNTTFFTVANLCNNHTDILHEIKSKGHEIGCHSKTHQFLTQLESDDLYDEIVTAKIMLEDELDSKVRGFRAPVLKQNEQIMEKVQDAGYEYDSSMIPSVPIPRWYGGDDVPLHPIRKNKMTEIPISVNPYTKIPISGFFLRFFGRKHLLWSIEKIQARNVVPVIYLHPFELASFENKNNWRQKIRTGRYTLKTVDMLCKHYNIVTMRNIAEQWKR